MKTKKILFALSGFVATTMATQAFPLYEAFDYDPGASTNLIGNISPDSIQWYQAGPNSGLNNQPWVDTGNLEYPGRAPSRGNRVRLGGNGTSARFSFKDIDAAITGTLYYSFIMRLNDVSTHNDTGFFWAGFNNSQGSQLTTPSVVAPRFATKNDVTNNIVGNYLMGFSKSSGSVGLYSYDTNSFTTNDIVFVVLAYTFVGDTPDNLDTARMWINPDPSTFGAATEPPPTLVNTAGTDQGNFRSFVLFNRSVNEPKDIVLDELLIGNNWADVTPGTNDMLTVPLKSQTVVAGNNVYFETRSQLADSLQWQFNGTNIAGATGELLIITNAQPAHGGTYSVVYSNLAGIVVSNATLAVVPVNTNVVLAPLWNLSPGSRSYVTVDSSAAPRQRWLAYSPLSNQVFIVDAGPANVTPDYAVYVLDGTTGADLYQLNTDTSVIFNTTDNSADRELNTIEVADDGSLYGGNQTFNASAAGRGFKLYHWTNSSSATPPQLLLGPQEPASSTTQHRWGDVLALRGSGTAAEVLLDDDTGMYGASIAYDSGLSTWISTGFFITKPRPTLGRSLQFGAGGTFLQKAKLLQYSGSGPVEQWGYDLGLQIATNQSSLDVVSSDLGPVAIDLTQNLMAGISFTPISGAADQLALYDISNIANPVLLARYDFPTNHQGNNNFFGKVAISGNRVYALNANNGVLAFEIVAPAPLRPSLTITPAGANVDLSWTTNAVGFTLESTPSLVPTIVWTAIGPGTIVGDRYVVTTNISTNQLFFRLKK